MPDIIKTGLRLFLITVIAAVILGFTNLATQGPIEEQKIKMANEARQAVLCQAVTFEKVEVLSEYAQGKSALIEEVHTGKLDGQILGYTFKVMVKGFGGDMEIIVGINTDDEVEAVEIGKHQETPGLGAKVLDQSFISQYHGTTIEDPLVVVKGAPRDEEIQAITGATITSDAVTNGVNLASDYYKKVLKEGGRN